MPTIAGERRPDSTLVPRARPAALLTAVACAFLTPAVGARAADPPADARRNVAQYVLELSSPLRAERQRAEKALLDLGPQALELLPQVSAIRDATTRVAVRQVRIKLERQLAEQSVLPSRITLRGTVSVADAATLISDQSGNALDAGRLTADVRTRRLTLDLDQATFWDSLDKLSASAPLGWSYDADRGAIQLEDDRGAAPVAAANVGAFRITVDRLSRERGTVKASLQLQGEPRLRPLFVRVADADFSAEGRGAVLPLFSPRAVTELPMTSRGPAKFAVLFRSSGPATAAITMRGRATVHVAAAPTEMRFADLTSNRVAYLRHGGVSVTLKRTQVVAATDGAQQLTARLAIAYDSGGPEFESHRTWIYHNEVWLESQEGARLPADGGFDATRQADGGVEVEYRFSNVPARSLRGWQLVYVAPALLIDVPVEFAFDECRVTSVE